jgi:hypothetical protein
MGEREMTEIVEESGGRTEGKWKIRNNRDENVFEKMKEEVAMQMYNWCKGKSVGDDLKVEDMWTTLRDCGVRCLEAGVGRAKGGVGGKKDRKVWYSVGYDKEIFGLKSQRKKLKRRILGEYDKEKREFLWKMYRNIKSKIRSRIKVLLTKKKKQIFDELEEILKKKNTKEGWSKIKKMMDWQGGKKKGTVPDVAVVEKRGEDGKTEIVEVKGVEGRDRVWKEAWMSLGLEDMSDEKFDNEYARMVVEEMKMRELDERAGWVNDRCENGDELNARITFFELRKAIKGMKRGKAAGVDEWVNELIEFGGERLEYCLWLMFSKVWDQEQVGGGG